MGCGKLGNPAGTPYRLSPMKRHIILFLAMALVVSACGSDEVESESTTTSTTLPPANPDERILEVRFEGGFAPVEFLFSQTPRFTLFGDGRLVFEGPTAAIFPGPLLPNLQVVDIGVDGLSDVLSAVTASGLPDVTEVINSDAANFVADAPNTVITYTDENGDHIYNVYALGITNEDQQLNSLQRIVDTLDELSVNSPFVGDYPSDRMQVIVGQAFGGGDVEATIEPWPLALAPGDVPDFVADLKCVVIDGDDAAAALPIFQAANQMTFFEEGGTEYRLTVRPLLIGEEGCRAG